MGTDKSRLEVGGTAIAMRAAAALAAVADRILVVGNDIGGEYERLDDDRRGPLAAMAAGAGRLGFAGAVLVLACDVPFVSPAVLSLIAGSLGDADAAIPVAGGRDQPLAACYAPRALVVAKQLVDGGSRAMRDLVAVLRVSRVPEEAWQGLAHPDALMDVDTPEDLARARRVAERH